MVGGGGFGESERLSPRKQLVGNTKKIIVPLREETRDSNVEKHGIAHAMRIVRPVSISRRTMRRGQRFQRFRQRNALLCSALGAQ